MALDNLDDSLGGDKWTAGYTKIKATIAKVNEIDANIPGGTTGQILEKSSSTDYDYTWVDNQDISGKLDSSKILIESTSGNGPTSFTAETTIATLVPSATKASAKMKYTFMGYYTNDVAQGATIRIRRAGTEIAKTITANVAGAQVSFCLVWIDTYTANQTITATAEAVADGGEISKFILLCEAFDAV